MRDGQRLDECTIGWTKVGERELVDTWQVVSLLLDYPDAVLVQRVPVRIALDPKELAERPLRIGLSTCPNDTFVFHGLLGYEAQIRDFEARHRAEMPRLGVRR